MHALVEDRFGFARAKLVSFHDFYAGQLVAPQLERPAVALDPEGYR